MTLLKINCTVLQIYAIYPKLLLLVLSVFSITHSNQVKSFTQRHRNIWKGQVFGHEEFQPFKIGNQYKIFKTKQSNNHTN